MPGQPQPPSVPAGILSFDVLNLAVNEPPGSLDPVVVMTTGSPFSMSVDFQGTGWVWVMMEAIGLQYIVEFTVEGGGSAPEIDFPPVIGNLVAGGTPYTITQNVPGGIAVPGVYEVAARVRFNAPPPLPPFLVQVIGFDSGVTIGVN